ncbi:MAG TPA: hypothetical protein VFS59_01355 [Gemmatimonadaceae bacterium]|nr:hypothetical protein [Gemmatimonadaceae bacterium]
MEERKSRRSEELDPARSSSDSVSVVRARTALAFQNALLPHCTGDLNAGKSLLGS